MARPLNKNVQVKIIFLISLSPYILWVLSENETVLLGTPKHMFKVIETEKITILR